MVIMDDLSKDLNTSFGESSIRRNKVRRKRRSKKKSATTLSSSIPKSSDMSDPNLNDDTEDFLYKYIQLDSEIPAWRHCVTNMGESDSVNEHFYPSREPRRKRKFKRMAVDPPSVTEQNFPITSGLPIYSQKNKRLRNLKSEKVAILSPKQKFTKITVAQISDEMKNICKEFKNISASCGKRKRCAHERSIECSGGDCKELFFQKCHSSVRPWNEIFTPNQCMKLDRSSKNRDSSSELSSVGSDFGKLSKDENREADDETSDCSHESMPKFSSPKVRPWYKHGLDVLDNEDGHVANNFELPDLIDRIHPRQHEMSKSGRRVRSARRRLGKKVSSIASKQDELSHIPTRNDSNILYLDNGFNSSVPNDMKKRKGMSPIKSK